MAPPIGFPFLRRRPVSRSLIPDQIQSRWPGLWAKLEHGRFREGYSALVRVAGNPRRIGGYAKLLVPGSDRGLAGRPIETALSPNWTEGVAIFRAAAHQDLAQVFVRFLAETQMLTASEGQPTNETDPAVANLVADLLGRRWWTLKMNCGRPGRLWSEPVILRKRSSGCPTHLLGPPPQSRRSWTDRVRLP